MLKLREVCMRFGKTDAIRLLNLEVGDGEVVGLIGPNGSGKTTLVNLISGVYPPTSGSIRFDGREISRLAAHKIARLGIARTFQNIRVYPGMTVRENLQAALTGSPSLSGRDEMDSALRQVQLADRAEHLAGELPLPERRRLELARVLVCHPRLVILDEPAGGMTPAETEDIAQLIKNKLAPGRACLIIEHKMNLITATCRRLCVLHRGVKLADGGTGRVLSDRRVIDCYIGTAAGKC